MRNTRRFCHWTQAMAAVVLAGSAGPVLGQAAGKAGTPAVQEGTQVDLETRDGVYLTAHYWTPKSAGKDTPAVILLHEWSRTQRDWFPLASQLCEDGFAVMTFDFRGHGDSRDIDATKFRDPKVAGKSSLRPSKSAKERIDAEEVYRKGQDIGEFFPYDLDAVKNYLIEQNNAERLNIKRLGIVGTEVGCSVAIKWMETSEYPPGRRAPPADLNAVVLITPWQNYKGLQPDKKFGEGGDRVPMLLISSRGKHASDAASLARSLKIPPEEGETRKRDDFFRPDSAWVAVESKVEGTELLRDPVARLDRKIRLYLTQVLKDKSGIEWASRPVGADAVGFGSKRPQ